MTDVLNHPSVGSAVAQHNPAVEIDTVLVRRASELVPLIRERAEQTSQARRVVPDVVKALEGAGLFKLFVPKRYGGHQANMNTAVQTIAEVARGDGSTAWAVALLNVCTWFATTFSQAAQDDVFGANPDAKVCGIFTPAPRPSASTAATW
ncbi:hypothetical protein SVIO_110350 [Streptomyces violaceusniger]|uniref:Acyl-CoA dehydrogenase/oxidase N-terminal domain-containing protein n=1 Tax=Streptomyces violaceusniger TaxID=68280 RepID=A0A4D4LGJ4_STRVO|nr:hypothetical protein SVIO_110350 [Streptomyces violaceusniger]